MRSSRTGPGGWILTSCLLFACVPSFARDCNTNGREDVLDIGAGTSEDCNDNGIPDECEGLPIELAVAGEEHVIGASPRASAAGDLDGDGDQDLVVGHRSGSNSTLTVLLNGGDQTFTTAAEYEPAGRLYHVSLADLNTDDFLDIIAANRERIVTFLNRGDGTFEPHLDFSPGDAEARFAIAADLDGDGAPDLLNTDRGLNTISFRRNTNRGDGKLDAPIAIDVDDDPDEAADPTAIAIGDFNQDGRPDVVTNNNGSRSFSVLLNAGDGTFTSPMNYAHGASSADPFSLMVADLNSDGFLDIATAATRTVVVLLSGEDGAFGEVDTYTGTGFKFLVQADYDRDGDVDLAVRSTTPQGILVKQNDGLGGFGVTQEVSFGSTVSDLVAGDFDGDGVADLAAVTSRPDAVVLLRSGGSGDAAGFSVKVEELPLVGCIEPRGCRPHGETLADIDGDGDLDAIGCVTHPGEFVIGENIDGVLVQTSDPWTFGTRNVAHGDHAQSVDSGDLDDDGDVDFVTVDNESHDFWVHINNGDATFENARFTRQGTDRRIRVGSQPIHVRLGDLDGDGDLDAASSNSGSSSISLLFNEGNGSFETTSRSIPVGSNPRATELADLDGDGAIDIAVATAGARTIEIFMNEGAGTFPRSGTDVRLLGSPYHVEAADLDRDGDLDLVAAIYDRGNCAVLLNDGDGTFPEPRSFGGGQSGAYSTAIADFDLDGLLDLITANEQGSSVSLLLGVGDGSFDPPIHYSIGAGKGLRLALPGDLDGDGDPDLVTNNRGSSDTTGHSFSVLYNESVFDTPDFLELVCTVGDFYGISTFTGAGDTAQRFLKYTLPTSPDAAFQKTLYQNSSRFSLHQDFLTRVFPEQFPALDAATYNSLVGLRDSRRYFVGAIRMIWTADGPSFGFSVFARFGDSKERLTVEEVKGIHDKLRESFSLEPFFYAPTSLEAVEVARGWQQEEPGFSILIEGATGAFEPYTIGVGYGRVRILTEEEFEDANDTGQLSFQDVLVLARAPRDIEGVVNGIITAERQGELSHVAVRTARRGTPNAFLRTALEDFAEYEGKLVRLEVTDSRHIVSEVTEQEAEGFWAANAGFLSHLPSLDEGFAELVDFDAINAMDGGVPPLEARFGGKASNLARLQTILTGKWSKYQLKGFAVPMQHYLQFIRTNTMNSFLDRDREVTYEEYLLELFDHEEFSSNSRFRFDALFNLRRHMRTFGQVDEDLLQSLRDRIAEVHGTPPEVRVRFRSSSNVEDAIEFNGAGLYESTQACVADDLDGDDDGPSICDDTKGGERDLTRALRRVWSSLWNFRAYEERAFYQIPDALPAMGVLCNNAFIDEVANGVAFTGNPTNRHDPSYVVTVQKGDASVVSPEPGILAEKNVLEMSEDGQVAEIIRAAASSEVAPGEFVLSDEELRELGALMWHIDKSFPVEPGIYERDDIILDMEIKKEADGSLAVKQVRSFLLVERGPVPPTFTLEIPADTMVCGVFNISRQALEEYELKAQLHFAGGAVEMPTAVDSFSASIVDRIVLGQGQDVATPLEPGKFTFQKVRGDAGLVIYRFDYEQKFSLPGGEPVDLTLSLVDFETIDGVIVDEVVVLDDAFLTDALSLETSHDRNGETVSNFYASCGYELLPLWDIRVELEDGTSVVLEERYRDDAFGDFQPARLTRATVDIAGERRVVTDYWDLVYKATRHNVNVEHLIVLDPPVSVDGLERPVYAVHLIAPVFQENIESEGIYRDENFEEIARMPTRTYERTEVLGGLFVRGDADGDGEADLADPLRILRYLFQSGASGGCVKSLDVNDNGSVEVTDGILLLGHLFRGGTPPAAPFPDCGLDPSPDGLSCERLMACE